jgi:hypothetical protein
MNHSNLYCFAFCLRTGGASLSPQKEKCPGDGARSPTARNENFASFPVAHLCVTIERCDEFSG